MTIIDSFRLHAKNLHRDYKTQTTYFDQDAGRDCFRYEPKFFDIDAILLDFDIPEEKFTLNNAQHVISKLAGFKNWPQVAGASEPELQLAKLLFDNMHKISAEEWTWYIFGAESDNRMEFDAEMRLDIFRQVFAEVDGHQSEQMDYRLERIFIPINEVKKQKQPRARQLPNKGTKKVKKISKLPIKGNDRKKFLAAADESFDYVLPRLEPRYPQIIRAIWNAEFFVDQLLIKPDMIPIDIDYALSLIEAFLVHHVMDLAQEAEIRASFLD